MSKAKSNAIFKSMQKYADKLNKEKEPKFHPSGSRQILHKKNERNRHGIM